MTQARLHAITPQEGRDSPEVIMGTLSIFGWPAYTLFDPGASHSFVSVSFCAVLECTCFATSGRMASIRTLGRCLSFRVGISRV